MPLECNPTSSSPGNRGGRPVPYKKKSKSHVLSKQGLRTKDTIDKVVEISEEDNYRPMPTGKNVSHATVFPCCSTTCHVACNNLLYCNAGYNSTKEKAKLQNVMAFGSDLEPVTAPKGRGAGQQREEEEEEIDRFEEVLGEIEERRQFLADMASLGQDKPHRTKIMTEISQVCT